MIHMIEEPLDVDGEEGGDKTLTFSLVDVVSEQEARIKTGDIGTAAKLIEWHEFVLPGIKNQMFSHDLFNQFSEAFNKLDGVMGAREGIVLFVRFRDGDNEGGFPSGVMDAEFDRSADDGAKFVRTRRMSPLQDLIVKAGEARSGGIGGARKSVSDFLFGDRDEGTGVWVRETLRDGKVS